jgi:hypothetical protein
MQLDADVATSRLGVYSGDASFDLQGHSWTIAPYVSPTTGPQPSSGYLTIGASGRPASSLTITNGLVTTDYLMLGNAGVPGTLTLGQQGVLRVNKSTFYSATSSVGLNGGTLEVGATYSGPLIPLTFDSGTLRLLGAVLAQSGTPLGFGQSFDAGKAVEYAGGVDITQYSTSATLNGGRLFISNVVTGGNHTITLNEGYQGVFEVGSDITVGASGWLRTANSGGVVLPGGATLRTTGTTTVDCSGSAVRLLGGTLETGKLAITGDASHVGLGYNFFAYDSGGNWFDPRSGGRAAPNTVRLTNSDLAVGAGSTVFPTLNLYEGQTLGVSGTLSLRQGFALSGGTLEAGHVLLDDSWYPSVAGTGGTIQLTGGDRRLGSSNSDYRTSGGVTPVIGSSNTPLSLTIDGALTLDGPVSIANGNLTARSLQGTSFVGWAAGGRGTITLTASGYALRPLGSPAAATIGTASPMILTLYPDQALVLSGTMSIPARTTLTLAGGRLQASTMTIAASDSGAGAEGWVEGYGTIQTNVTNAGVLNLWTSNDIEIQGDLSNASTSKTFFRLSKDDEGVDNTGRLDVTGTASLAGTLGIGFSGTTGSRVVMGDGFQLIHAVTLTGDFGPVWLPSLPTGLFWKTERDSSNYGLRVYGSSTVTTDQSSPVVIGAGTRAVEVDFSGNITSGGSLEVIPHFTPADVNPALDQGQPYNFSLTGDTAQTWMLTFSGAFEGPTSITFHYDASLLATGTDESLLSIYHFTGSQWEELPVLARDFTLDTITVQTTSFSPFALAVVPEPSSVLVLASGASVLALRRRRVS